LYTVTYAGKSVSEKASDFAATTRYKPLHFNFCIPSPAHFERFVENIGLIVVSDALRPISDALSIVPDALRDISDALSVVPDALTLADDDLRSIQPVYLGGDPKSVFVDLPFQQNPFLVMNSREVNANQDTLAPPAFALGHLGEHLFFCQRAYAGVLHMATQR